MKGFFSKYRDFVRSVDDNSFFDEGFTESVLKRSFEFERDFEKKNFNVKLSRQIYLVSIFASLVFYYLNKAKKPSYVKWVSDRDAINKRYDRFLYDLVYFMFLGEVNQDIKHSLDGAVILLDKPKFIFPVEDELENGCYDELIKISDYLAGTLADYDMRSGKFSKGKFYTVFYNSLVESKNHSVIQVYGNTDTLSSRRIMHKFT